MRGQPGHGKGVNELQWRIIPLLASPQGGVAASSRKFRVATEADAAGVVFLFVFKQSSRTSVSPIRVIQMMNVGRNCPVEKWAQGSHDDEHDSEGTYDCGAHGSFGKSDWIGRLNVLHA